MQYQHGLKGKVESVRQRALRHAERSTKPWEFLEHFGDSLDALLTGSELAEQRMDLSDPVEAAAEIEALCAHRAIERWGTFVGLCQPDRDRYTWK